MKVVKLQLRDISGCLAPIFRPASRPVGLHNARKLVLANLILFAALRFRRVTGLMSDGKANREIPEQCLPLINYRPDNRVPWSLTRYINNLFSSRVSKRLSYGRYFSKRNVSKSNDRIALFFFFIPLFNFPRLFGKRNSILSLVVTMRWDKNTFNIVIESRYLSNKYFQFHHQTRSFKANTVLNFQSTSIKQRFCNFSTINFSITNR